MLLLWHAARADAWAVVAVAVTPVFCPSVMSGLEIRKRDRRDIMRRDSERRCGSPVDDVLGSLRRGSAHRCVRAQWLRLPTYSAENCHTPSGRRVLDLLISSIIRLIDLIVHAVRMLADSCDCPETARGPSLSLK